ncbi:MAG TPA: alpha/beta hydrolase [Reyranellaceae bacterium]|nr:alpha/beta hydrolase [Reyranellaceae bacterium]
MPTLDLGDGRKLNYREEGNGPPLVLVHGSPADSRAWNRVVPFLRDRYRLVMPDLPGYGGSDPVPDPPKGRAALMGSALARLIESVGPAAVAAHSYGGLVALQATVQAKPGTVTRLIVLEPMFMRGLQILGDPALAPATAYFEDYCRRVDAGEDGAVRLMIDFWFGNGAYERLPDPVRAYLNANAALNVLDVRSSFNDIATAEQLGALKQPVLMIYGDKSPDVVPAMGRALVKLVPNARMEVLAGANHGMLDFHAEAVARLIAP